MVEASCRPAALAPDTECYTTDDGCALEQQRQQRQQQQLQEQRSDARDGPIAHTPPGDHEAPTTDGPVNELATSCMPGDCGTSRVDTTDREAGQGKGKGTGGPAEWGGEEQEEDEQEEDENTDFDVIRWAARVQKTQDLVRTHNSSHVLGIKADMKYVRYEGTGRLDAR